MVKLDAKFLTQVREQLRILMELAEKKGLGEMLSAISEEIKDVMYHVPERWSKGPKHPVFQVMWSRNCLKKPESAA